MSRYRPSLEEAAEALEASNGALRPAAEKLGIPLHFMRTLVEDNAELQAIVANRDIEIADRSRDTILEFLRDEEIPVCNKLNTSKWALEHLASNIYNKKQAIDLNSNKSYDDMTEEELKEKIAALQKQIGLKSESSADEPTAT